MTSENLGGDLMDIFEGVDMEQFVYCQRNMLLEYIARWAKSGLPYDLEEFMPEMLLLFHVLESIPTGKKRINKGNRKII
jgi:hypothetical protein